MDVPKKKQKERFDTECSNTGEYMHGSTERAECAKTMVLSVDHKSIFRFKVCMPAFTKTKLGKRGRQ